MSGIELNGLGKRFGTRTAVEGLTFSVLPGEVFGLLGPNGAGKTTTVRMLAGLLSPSEGDARVEGISIRDRNGTLRQQVGLLTEQPGLYDRLSARDNLRFFIKLHELDEKAAWKRAEPYLARFGLKGREGDATGSFSKGMRQKLAIVRTLLHQPRVLFLDEPTSGLDPESARTVRDVVAELASEGRTVVLCSHNLHEVERLCTRVAVVKQRLLAVARVEELRRAGLTLHLRVQGSAEKAAVALAALSLAGKVLTEGSSLRVFLSSEEDAPEVLAALVRAGVRVYSAVRGERPLEEVYLELMREET